MLNFFSRLCSLWNKRNSEVFIRSLRGKGIRIGNNCVFRRPATARIDVSRPSLITIGDKVDMNMYFQILIHDWACSVFRNRYSDFVNSSGAVHIGNNIYFGTNVCVLKGVSIGDNCVIGAYSLVTHDIPSNSVAAGVPCKVISSLDKYFEKRKSCALEEAVEYVNSIRERFGRDPSLSEMKEEFVYFVDAENISAYSEIPIKYQLGSEFEGWLLNHHRMFDGFEEFLKYCSSGKLNKK